MTGPCKSARNATGNPASSSPCRAARGTGLAADDSRTLTITSETDALGDYTGMGALVGIAPLLIFVAVIGAVVFGAYSAFK